MDLKHKLEPKVLALLKANHIKKPSGTWLHALAKIIHTGARLTAVLHPFQKKVHRKPAYLASYQQQNLKTKMAVYGRLIAKHQDEHGFVLYQWCDATLFSALISGVKELQKPVNLQAARDKDGYWHRRPIKYPECYEWDKNNGSTISRDMMWGIAWYCWLKRDLKLAQSTYEHIKKHSYVMGFGDPARLIMMPALEQVFCLMIEALGGPKQGLGKYLWSPFPKSLKGYEVHLLVLQCLMLGELQGWIPKAAFEALEGYAKRYPENPLFQLAYRLFLDGNLTPAYRALMNERIWPKDRLPTNLDRYSDWVTQRTSPKDWAPEPVNYRIEHSGGDFLHVAYMILHSLEN